ncbi:DsbA family protein [Peribacillus sp. SCS-26]|uniref:DsbA family protein n=1 Tax=Paraperibacillus marinus TaxID=3115295 RepID=UPI003906AFCF
MKTKKTGQSNLFFFLVVGLIIAAAAGIAILSNMQGKEASFDYRSQPYLGKESAPVNIVEFGDYKCPVCKNFTLSVFPQIKKDLIDTGKAKLYFMNDPIIYKDSSRSALFGETVFHELGNAEFWKFHDELYKQQPDDPKYEQMDIYSASFLTRILKENTGKNNVDKVMKAFDEEKYEKELKNDLSLVKELGVTGTPTFFVNGKQFKGKTYQDLIDMVNKEAKEKQSE